MSEDSNKVIEKKIADLENVNRLVANTINLISDVEIKGAYAAPVAEILAWLTGFKEQVTSQMTVLKTTLPQPVAKPVDVPVSACTPGTMEVVK